MIRFSSIFLSIFPLLFYAQGKTIYTDYKPDYQQFMSNYIIDKIEYTETRTIIHFRFVADMFGGEVVYYSKNGDAPWYLKNTNPKSGEKAAYELIEIRNIKENGKLKVKLLSSQPEVRLQQVPKGVYTCEVHFERLPSALTQVDLIEGRGYEADYQHFNAFKVPIKPFDSDKLGDEEEMKKKIIDFEKKNGVSKPTLVEEPPKEKPKEEIKEDPKEEIHKEAPKVLNITKEDLPLLSPPNPNTTTPNWRVSCIFAEGKADYQSMMLSSQYLEWTYQYLIRNPKAFVRIVGHADINFKGEKGLALSQKRADKVKSWLLSRKGISPQRIIETIAYGSNSPKRSTVSGRNRRVEIEIFE